jgi:hypothetical protein
MSLAGSDSFRIFDTDYPNGDLAGFFPQNSQIIDLAKTGGQVELFDTIMGEPQFDYVIDLQAERLAGFMKLYNDISFDAAGAEAHITTSFFFLLDRTLNSVSAALKLQRQLKFAQFIPVRNEALGNILTVPQAARIYGEIRRSREIILPRLSVEALNYMDRPDFSFADFITRNGAGVPTQLRIELWGFLESVYNQRQISDDGGPIVL